MGDHVKLVLYTLVACNTTPFFIFVKDKKGGIRGVSIFITRNQSVNKTNAAVFSIKVFYRASFNIAFK